MANKKKRGQAARRRKSMKPKKPRKPKKTRKPAVTLNEDVKQNDGAAEHDAERYVTVVTEEGICYWDQHDESFSEDEIGEGKMVTLTLLLLAKLTVTSVFLPFI